MVDVFLLDIDIHQSISFFNNFVQIFVKIVNYFMDSVQNWEICLDFQIFL